MYRTEHIFAGLIIAISMLYACSTENKVELTSEQNQFDEISIGDQTWMQQNLDVLVFRNGDTIPEAKSPEEWQRAANRRQAAWYRTEAAGDSIEGKLYNWYAVVDRRNIAPEGWHIPSEEEWSNLISAIGGHQHGSMIEYQSDTLQDEQIGFNAVAFGNINELGERKNQHMNAYWWTSSGSNADFARNVILSFYTDSISEIAMNKRYGLSVRCVKDLSE